MNPSPPPPSPHDAIVPPHPQPALVKAGMFMLGEHMLGEQIGDYCITFETKPADSYNAIERMRINKKGVSIGTKYSGAKLEVNGDIDANGYTRLGTLEVGSIEAKGYTRLGQLIVNGDIKATGYTKLGDIEATGYTRLGHIETTGNITVKRGGDISFEDAADCAEDFDIVESVQPGTVMVIDREGALRASEKAYDKRVAGVISGAGDLRPGITLDSQKGKANRLPLALTGKVYCKVDAKYNRVEVGDLLTTSATVGHAMKADDCEQAFGAVIGKALRPLDYGQRSIIPILVSLQ